MNPLNELEGVDFPAIDLTGTVEFKFTGVMLFPNIFSNLKIIATKLAEAL